MGIPTFGAWLIVPCALSACYNPDYAAAHYACDDHTPCPTGFSCNGGRCANPSLASGGCAGANGSQVGNDIHACPGLFNAAAAKNLCQTGYDICADGTGVSADACGTSGFFATRATAYRVDDDPTDDSCKKDGDHTNLMLVGCGKLNGSTLSLKKPCGSLSTALDCVTDNQWVCAAGIDAATNRKEPTSGVLCCRVK